MNKESHIDKTQVHDSDYPGSDTGGVLIGDTTHIMNYVIIIVISLLILISLHKKRKQTNEIIKQKRQVFTLLVACYFYFL